MPPAAGPPSSRSRRVALVVAGVAGLVVVKPWVQTPACPPIATNPDWTVARRWDEALLDAIRRALPNPPVHARNLFHTSVAMWDAWAAYDSTASGLHRQGEGPGVERRCRPQRGDQLRRLPRPERSLHQGRRRSDSLSEFANLMDDLCYPLTVTSTDGDSPAAVGNRIAKAVLAYGLADGSNEAGGYASPDYKPVNPPLVVNKPGTTMTDPNRWQPLQIEHMISQNGIPIVNGVQQAVGPHWGHVTPFALPAAGADGVPMDPGPPPHLGDPATDQAFKDQAVEVIRDSSQLDPANKVMIDISPGVRGNNSLGLQRREGSPGQPGDGPAVRRRTWSTRVTSPGR